MTQQDIATSAPSAPQHQRRAGRIVFWVPVALALAVLAASIAIPVVTIQPYLEQSTSMQPTIPPGDRILAAGGSSGIRRGDIVVLRVPARISGTDDLFVKRVIGLPGDHVACCDAKGDVTVDGKPLNETYLYPGNPPSRTRFSVTVGRGKIWVMGDHRNISVDSRTWGPVPASGVAGQVILVGHGSSFAAVRTPRTFVADGLAPADSRLDLYAGLALAAAASLAALLLLAIFGIARFVIRRRGRGAAPAGPAPPPTLPRPLVQPLYGVYRIPLQARGEEPGPAKATGPAPATAADPAPARTASPAPATAADPAPAKTAGPAPATAAGPAPAKTASPAPAKTANPGPAKAADSS